MELNKTILGDALTVLKTFPDNCINCCITSPPYYGLRNYDSDGQIGNEETPELFIKNLTDIFNEVRRVLTDDGTLWLNIGDTYASTSHTNRNFINHGGRGGNNPNISSNMKMIGNGVKEKDLIGIPWMLAFSLRNSGWHLRQDIIWHKLNPMPEPALDRCVKSHEYIFLLTKNDKYYFDREAIQEKSVTQEKPRNKRDVWSVSVSKNKKAHFATYPEALITPCALAGCPEGGIILDPFMGSGTTGKVALKNNRNFIGIELNPEYKQICDEEIEEVLKNASIGKEKEGSVGNPD